MIAQALAGLLMLAIGYVAGHYEGRHCDCPRVCRRRAYRRDD